VALVAAAFAEIGRHGWARMNLVRAARAAGIAPAVARRHLPGRGALLLRFGALADAHALPGVMQDGPVRDQLFDIVMRRIDFLQMHRAGVVALLRALPGDPLAAATLAAASLRSMAWLLEGAGIGAAGPAGALRAAGLLAVWTWTVRAWERDTSEDLSATMAALDGALLRAERAAGWLAPRGGLGLGSAAPADDVSTAAVVQQEDPEHGS
jgi:AcrR family transcriptional regulator